MGDVIVVSVLAGIVLLAVRSLLKSRASGGCGGVVGVGAIAVVVIAAAGLVSFKKKED